MLKFKEVKVFMLKFLRWIFGLFSPYVHPFEKKVDKFFKKIKSTDSISTIRKKLLSLMQENLVVLSVWMERKYKGYVYLSKSARKKMYVDVEKIVEGFFEEEKNNPVSDEEIKKDLAHVGLSFPHGDEDSIRYLYAIMRYLRPGNHYNYIKTASFGKLLRNPSVQKLEGDCNQIVTLYMFLYSLRFPLENIRIKLLPEHVCLHFRNIDIEATNATFQKYSEDGQVLPATEIVSTNLLDLTDFREDVQQITPRVFIKSAQLAYAISSLKPLVEKNLKVAYHNMAVGALKSNDFETAIFYFQKNEDNESLKNAYRNGALYWMKVNNFKKAMYFADRSSDRDIVDIIRHNEGVYHFKNGRISEALKIFIASGDSDMQKACYAGMYNDLVKKVAFVKTLDDAKRHKSTYLKMLDLARKMGDQSLEKGVRDTLSKI